MQSRSIPSVTLYIRITDEKGNRHYERVNRRKPQLNGGVYCLHFCEDGKRKWITVGTDINAALKARMEKESQLLTRPVEVEPSPGAPQSLEELRTAFIHDKKTTFKKDGSPLDADTITHYEQVTRIFLSCKTTYNQPGNVTEQEGRVIFAESAHTAAFLYGSTELAYGDMVSADFTDTTIQWRGQHGEKPQYSLSRITGTLMVTHSINWQCQKATQKF
jgi:hypothetical protein